MFKKILKVFLVIGLVVLVPFFGLYLWFLAPQWEWTKEPNRIGVVEIEGLLRDARPVLDSLAKFRRDTSVKAVVLRVESPGGGVGASQEVYREVRRTAMEKPVVASLGGIAASGGYYASAAATYIIANPGTLTGSLGVVAHLPNLEGLFDKVGYRTVTIKSGQFKDVGNPGRAMTDAEIALLQETLDGMHGQFIKDVAEGRRLPLEQVRAVADGRVLSGEKALELKLVDALGNFQDAVIKAKDLGGVVGEPRIVYADKERRSLLRLLLGAAGLKALDQVLDPALCPVRYELLLGQ
ncbi:MAG: signal peptide peptidase SppA [Desulfosoma sp.]|uniref:signal peptide peptidase SppA n=1 Tax=Desulfosoma sp. TaxID=2603217 RepID=UPI00404B54D4